MNKPVWSGPPFPVEQDFEDPDAWNVFDSRYGHCWLASFATESLADEYAQWKTEQTGKAVLK